MRKFGLSGLICLVLMGCQESTSTATAPRPDAPSIAMAIPSEGIIFQIDEMRLYEMVSSSFQQVLPESSVSVITFPERGYVAKWLAPPYYVDWYYITVKMVRAEGLDTGGNRKSGYIVDVSGRGSSFLQGNLKRDQLSDLIVSTLYDYGKPITVKNLMRVEFELNKEAMYVVGADHLR